MIIKMNENFNSNPLNEIMSCPFSQSCALPKLESLCNFPDYKLCPDYQIRLQKLKSSTKVLH